MKKESEVVLKDDEYSEHAILMFSYSSKWLLNVSIASALLSYRRRRSFVA